MSGDSNKTLGNDKSGVFETLLEGMYRVKEFALTNSVEPWAVGRLTAAPCNGLTGVSYSGLFNRMQLMLASARQGYSDSRFVPLGSLKKISKKIEGGLDWRGATTVKLWYPMLVKVSDAKASCDDDESDRRVVFKQFRALNVSEIKGDIERALKSVPGFEWMSEDVEARAEEYRDRLLARFNEPPAIRTVPSIDHPQYSLSKHEISMPRFCDYYSLEFYLRDLTHELAHATQAALGRELKEKLCSVESSKENYVAEELAVHLATVHIMMDYGLVCDEKREADYILGWYNSIESDEGMFKTAINEAQSIARFFASE